MDRFFDKQQYLFIFMKWYTIYIYILYTIFINIPGKKKVLNQIEGSYYFSHIVIFHLLTDDLDGYCLTTSQFYSVTPELTLWSLKMTEVNLALRISALSLKFDIDPNIDLYGI